MTTMATINEDLGETTEAAAETIAVAAAAAFIKDPNESGVKAVLNEAHLNKCASPLRKKIVKKHQLDQLEATQKLLSDFELKSPRKRAASENSNEPLESPSKRATLHNDSKNSSITDSPRPRLSKFSLTGKVETLSSTPKGKHKPNFQNLCDKDDKVERNLSKSWIDIMDELEEQATELRDYTGKICEKYKLQEEDLLKNIETDSEILRKRQKQINYGKLTEEYRKYSAAVSRKQRKSFDPRTPNKFRKCSRRKFDGLVKKWRRLLHIWIDNPENLKDAKFLEDDDDQDANENNTTDFDIDTKFTLDDFTITTTNSSSEEASNNENL